jgi:hypothetical protein
VELLGLAQDTGKGNVALPDGQLRIQAVDLKIPGRGFPWRFERTYRSGITFDGPLGQNWEFNYNRRLFVEEDGTVVRMDGYDRADRYLLQDGVFRAPAGFYTHEERG